MRTPKRSSMSVDEFVVAISRTSSEVKFLYDEHIGHYDELLLHVLMADLRRYAWDLHDRGESDELKKLLAILDEGVRSSDERLENAVAVSFVEDSCAWEPSARAFVRTWPRGLQREAARQLAWELRKSRLLHALRYRQLLRQWRA